MRLNQEQQVTKYTVERVLGTMSRVWLFGSRVDDSLRGGDIDLLIETDVTGDLMKIPKLPPSKRLEAIFLIISENVPLEKVRRTPHSDIAGKTKIIGDIFESVPASSWDFPK